MTSGSFRSSSALCGDDSCKRRSIFDVEATMSSLFRILLNFILPKAQSRVISDSTSSVPASLSLAISLMVRFPSISGVIIPEELEKRTS